MDIVKSEIKKTGECKREIEVEISADSVIQEFNKVLARYANSVKIRGFRQGKTPKDIVKRMYYQEIQESVTNSLVPKALETEIHAKDISPVGNPVVNSLSIEYGKPLVFKAEFEVLPEFNLPDYKKITIKKRQASVTQAEINQALKDLQYRLAQYVPIEGRGVVNDDYVVVEIQGRDIKSKKFLPSEKVVVLAGHHENEKVLNENILGMKLNEQKNFVINYNEDHPNKKLAGKGIEYNLKVLSIKERNLPEINDDFAKEFGEYKDLKSLKSKIKEELLASKKNTIKRSMTEELMQKLADKVIIELPESLVEQEYLSILRQYLSTMQKQGLKPEELENLKTEVRKKAVSNIKNHLILTKIAQKENLQVSENELNDELNKIAHANNLSVEKVKESFEKDGKIYDLRNNLLLRKVVDFLMESTIIEE